MKFLMFYVCFFTYSFSHANIDYRPYDFSHDGSHIVRTYLNSEEAMDEQFEDKRSLRTEELGLNSYFETDQNFESDTLIGSLRMILNSYDVGKVLFLTTLKDPTATIEQRITDKNSVALENKPVLQFLQSSYCLVLTPLRHFMDPLCRRDRADAQETIDELRDGKIWFEYIASADVVKITLDESNQKTLSLYEFNPWSTINSQPIMSFNSYTIEDLAKKLEVAYYFHSFRRNTYISTRLFKVYETD